MTEVGTGQLTVAEVGKTANNAAQICIFHLDVQVGAREIGMGKIAGVQVAVADDVGEGEAGKSHVCPIEVGVFGLHVPQIGQAEVRVQK